MFRAGVVIRSSRGGSPKGRSTKSQSYEQSSCVDGLRGDLPSGHLAEQLVGWSGKQSVALTQLESISGKYKCVLKWLLVGKHNLLL